MKMAAGSERGGRVWVPLACQVIGPNQNFGPVIRSGSGSWRDRAFPRLWFVSTRMFPSSSVYFVTQSDPGEPGLPAAADSRQRSNPNTETQDDSSERREQTSLRRLLLVSALASERRGPGRAAIVWVPSTYLHGSEEGASLQLHPEPRQTRVASATDRIFDRRRLAHGCGLNSGDLPQ